MKNFAEEMVYWYLRFNGFFPLTNFVLHRTDLTSTQNADADILGVRPKYVTETVGEGHLDEHLFSYFDLNKTIGVICEVKSSQQNNLEILLNREDRLQYALKRIGFFSSPKVSIHSRVLVNEAIVSGNYHQVGKVLFTNRPINRPDFICISLHHVEEFLLERIDLFPNEKDGAKLFFDSNLMQYLIWKRTR